MAEGLRLSYRNAMVAICFKFSNSFIADNSCGKYQSLQSNQSRTDKVPEIRMMLSTKLELRS